jgi:hypothetical protein
VSTKSAEDHVWITKKGQWIVARNIEWDDDDDDGHRCSDVSMSGDYHDVKFVDFLEQKVVGLKREGTMMELTLREQGLVKCESAKKFDQLLALGVGAMVNVYNLTLYESSGNVHLTEKSGIRGRRKK